MNLSNYLSNPVITGILGAIGGVTLTLLTKFGEGWINLFFENIKQKKAKKIEAAKDINSFCIEGMHKGFNIKAGSEQHIKLRATEIEAIDVAVGAKLRQFIDSWSRCRDLLKHRSLTPAEDEKLAKDYRDNAQRLAKELLEVARKWGSE